MSEPATTPFGRISTLSTKTWPADKLRYIRKRSSDSVEPFIRRFIDINRKSLDYLGITATIATDNRDKPTLRLTASKYVGAIPIFSPLGSSLGDLVVTGRFGEEVGELIALLDDSIRPEYSDELRLASDSQITPPIFIECCKYIDTYIEAERVRWLKFTNVIKTEKRPTSSTLWGEYALRTAKNPLESNTYKNKRNILTAEHDEWAQLNYVLRLAIERLESVEVPQRVKAAYIDKIEPLKVRLSNKQMLATDKIITRMSDPYVIRQLKALAAIIINNKSNEKRAWRMDYAEFFERYVQFLFREVARKSGATEINNPHYPISGSHRLPWGLSYLEPDIVLQRGNVQYVIDAKYKSHMYNLNENSVELKDAFRQDFHQILAYNSFTTNRKCAILVYPYTDFTYHKMEVSTPFAPVSTNVYLVGVPLERSKVEKTTNQLNKLLMSE